MSDGPWRRKYPFPISSQGVILAVKMMKLADKVTPLFDPQVRTRGNEYFMGNAVTLIDLSPGVATFKVQGSDKYDVEVYYDGKDFNCDCSCPYSESGFKCKHAWAAILDIDTKHMLPKMLVNATDNSTGKAPTQTRTQRQIPWRQKIESIKKGQADNTFETQLQNIQKNNTPRVGTYVLELQRSLLKGQIQLSLYMQERLKKGHVGKLKPAELTSSKIAFYEDPAERDFLWDLIGRTETAPDYYSNSQLRNKTDKVYLTTGHADSILRKISDARKLHFRKDEYSNYFGDENKENEIRPYTYTNDRWSFRLSLEKCKDGYNLLGNLYNEGGERRSLDQAIGSVEHFVFFKDFCARSDVASHNIWLELLSKEPLFVPDNEINTFLDYIWSNITSLTPIDLPPEIEFIELDSVDPSVQLFLESDKNSGLFAAKLGFLYNSKSVSLGSGLYIYDVATRERRQRNIKFEKLCHEKFLTLNALSSEDPEIHGYFTQEHFITAIEKAFAFGWDVLARDQKITVGGDFKLTAASGVDWFDLSAEFEFGEQKLMLPQLLHALRTGQRMVKLGDGSTGILPEEWLSKLAPMLSIGSPTEDGIRLSRVQALFLSSNFVDHVDTKKSTGFNSLLKLLEKIKNLKPLAPDTALKGKLRPYQKEGLAWLSLLAENKIGGVLADDMGLGKTIQVLAHLSKHKSKLPSLIICPRSVVFNWENECSKFTPHLKTLVYSGANRKHLQNAIKEHDLIITTYQTLRNDIETIKNVKFEFLILDEAHNVKNSQAQITMAAKLIDAKNKIALTGTPIENSIMDLFSILSIVNPGLISDVQANRWAKETDAEKIQSLSRALSPFLLRRTKEQVLKDLPEKSEQVLMCELSEPERKRYDELKTFYWGQLSKSFEQKGLGRSKIEVLEALLRLRQASCHQGLLDSNLADGSSAKFDMVLEQLDNVIKDGHKALVFSQFTTLLELFSRHLRANGVKYEYLDGSTKNRGEVVANFQNSKTHQVFLLSLKAGGVGLNLTAADYVFILDPWWNPAAEAQAIDRTHRIGQKNKVFAYKVIAKDTIEEKILEMQQKKKKLAKAIISEDTSLLKSLKLEDLKSLFE